LTLDPIDERAGSEAQDDRTGCDHGRVPPAVDLAVLVLLQLHRETEMNLGLMRSIDKRFLETSFGR